MMNAIPYTMTTGDEPTTDSGARYGSTPPVSEVDDSFSKCMSWVSDYDDEWSAFIEHHTVKANWARRKWTEDEAPLRVWNYPRE